MAHLPHALMGISSMATAKLLRALADACERDLGIAVRFESVGGVDAARRVRAGESFDLVVLAVDAIDELAATGCVIAEMRRAIADSSVAIAVRAGAARPDVSSAQALRQAVLSAGRIGYSTGPSGSALLALFTRWGIADTLRDKLVQAQPGTPVAALLASGQADIGFQQFSELKDEQGVTVIGPMPLGLEVVTRFVAAIGAGSSKQTEARAVIDFLSAPAVDEIRSRHGMTSPEPTRLVS